MSDPLLKHFVYLSKQLTNLRNVLNHLEQHEIISQNESENILHLSTTLERNVGILRLLRKKDWNVNEKTVLEIFRKTLNDHCANVIEGKKVEPLQRKVLMLEEKWWPAENDLPERFHWRKNKGRLLVEEIHDLMFGGNRKIAIVGRGGVGKSTTALWFAKYYQEEFDHIIWLDIGHVDHPSNPIQSLPMLSDALKLETNAWYDLKLTAINMFKILSGLKCLFVFDNVPLRAMIVQMISYCHKNFHVIVTSTEPQWNIPTISVDFFKPEESLELLKTNLEVESVPDVEIEELCQYLNDWPLALQIAMEAIISEDYPLEEYLDDIKYNGELIHEKFRGHSIYESMTTAMKVIDKSGEVILRVALAFGCAEEENLEVEYFKKSGQFETSEVESALEFLKMNFLVQKNKTETKVEQWKMPNLIQKCVNHHFKDFISKTSRSTQQWTIAYNWKFNRHHLKNFNP